MYPLLFEIPLFGGIRIYTYGLLVALGFVVGISWIVRAARRDGVNTEQLLDLIFYLILAGLVGARLLYILVEWRQYAADPLAALRVWEGGLVFYGGVVACLIVGWFYCRRHRLHFFQMADLIIPGLALGHAIGRLGCLAAGCCYGRVAPGFFAAIHFPGHPLSLAPAGVPLYPTQLMEMGAELIIFILLLAVRRRKKFHGQVLIAYFILYSIARIGLETFRGDGIRGFLIPGWISTSQFISILLILAAGFIYGYLRPLSRQQRPKGDS